jgi:hypothetical protein
MWPASQFRALTDIEHLQLAVPARPATGKAGQRESLGALDVSLFLAPRRHASGQVARDVGHADRGSERDGLARAVVTTPDDQDRSVGVGQPREL